MNKSEQLATKYAEENNSCFTNDYYGFLAGYRAKENEIQQVIDELVLAESEIERKPPVEQIFMTRELNHIKSKIQVLKKFD